MSGVIHDVRPSHGRRGRSCYCEERRGEKGSTIARRGEEAGAARVPT